MKIDSEKNKILNGRVIAVSQIDATLKDAMFALMQQFYHSEKPAFLNDLSNKTAAVILEDPQGVLRGFTSAALFDLSVNGKPVKILFSGDTIIHPDFWGSLELPRVWGKFMYETLQKCGETPLYWFLISSGYKTYRFLPAYFLEFFPRFDCDTPPTIQKILDAAATSIFANRYEADQGIIKLQHPTPLKAGISDPTEERLQNPHIAFFLQKNPGYIAGDELACLTQLTWENFKPFVKRLLKR
ncbi:MAG: hypothetical protein EOM80_08825 [Erysipelotrichia bacterium]|nr:hypothetical protein [Erysipelotrichia bacterium]